MIYSQLMTDRVMYACKKWIIAAALVVFCAISSFSRSDFVTVRGHQFWLGNKPYYFVGTNYWYGPLLAIDDNVAHRIRLVNELDFLKRQGVVNLRIMAAVEGSGLINGVLRVQPASQLAAGVFSEKILLGLDFLLAEMGKRNMKAVLFLSNNWEWSGGFMQYVNWFNLVQDSVLRRKLDWDEQRDITSKFYTCKPCKEAYLKQVNYIVSRKNTVTNQRYVDDPVIMAWQLANEPRPMRPIVNEAYFDWIQSASSFIKKMDQNHLISIGHEGYMATDGDMSLFEKIHAEKNIDYLTIHIWAKNWSWFNPSSMHTEMNTIKQKAKDYIETHKEIASKINKPLVIEEFGLPRDNHTYSPKSTTNQRDQYFEEVFKVYFNSKQKQGVLAGLNFWAFGGAGRPVSGQLFWKDGDDYTGDPPMEEQGLNTVFDSDSSTWKLIRKYR